MQAKGTDTHLDFVNVVDVDGREDGIYVFARLHDADRFKAVVNHDSADEDSPAFLMETPINVGAAAERLIAAERGDVIESLGWPSVAEEVREGVPLAKVTDRVTDTMDEDGESQLLPVLQGWLDEDTNGGRS